LRVGAKPLVCVLKADGTNCEVETAHALVLAGAEAEIVPMNLLRWRERGLSRYDAMVVPGGFSYGDDVASGQVMAVEMMSFLADEMDAFAGAGKPILGICNGFQVLVRTGLLPFGELGRPSATLAVNVSGRYECRWVRLKAETGLPFLEGAPELLWLPAAHGEGRFLADAEAVDRAEADGLVCLRYADDVGEATEQYPANPNGSSNAIAGVCAPSRRVLGLMPHPERYVSRWQHPGWHAGEAPDVPDGLRFIQGFVALA
jgi:phosphoribosylformylglycinamidine synthase